MVAEVVLIVALVGLVAFVVGLAVLARAGVRSSEHSITMHDDGFRCACGRSFGTEEAALSHAERRRDEVGPPEEYHPQLGLPHR